MRLATAQSFFKTLGVKPTPPPRAFRTGLNDLNDLAPGGAFQCGAVHELLWRRRSALPRSFALLLAKAAQTEGGVIVWSDPRRELHPPALSAAGIDLRRFLLLRCANRAEEIWTLAECLRCRGVSATVAAVESLSRIEARRLQLAAERGGGVGIFLRPFKAATNAHYAAASRWLVQPAPLEGSIARAIAFGISPSPGTPGEGWGEGLGVVRPAFENPKQPSPYPSPGVPGEGNRGSPAKCDAPGSIADRPVQRWSVELLHGHGGRLGQVLLLEVDRETRQWSASPPSMHASAALADRSAAPSPARATA